MNYRHSFHAGNHADVLKHAVLLRMLALMQGKETPLCYLDSHAGTALYDLRSDAADPGGKYLDGIGRLWERSDLPGLLGAYRDAVADYNSDGQLRWYPGSAQLMADRLREQDRMIVSELHPEFAAFLKQHYEQDQRIGVHHRDGYELPKAFLPVPEKRALWLLDPPFEKEDDLQRCVSAMQEAIARMRQTIIALWYPIKDQRLLDDFYRQIADAGFPKVLRIELHVRPTDTTLGMNGSGLMLVNPPWPLWEELAQVLPWLATELAVSGSGNWNMDWLAGEP